MGGKKGGKERGREIVGGEREGERDREWEMGWWEFKVTESDNAADKPWHDGIKQHQLALTIVRAFQKCSRKFSLQMP